MSSSLVDEDPVAWVAAQPIDPVRRRVLHALALRAQAQPPGVLRDKLLALLLRRAAGDPPPMLAPQQARAAPSRALAGLLELLQADAGPELRQLRLHQSAWRQLRVARSLAEIQAPVAGALGPLNGQALATRALQQIQQLAPDYLHRLLAQMEALAALELVPAPVEAEKAARGGRKKAARR